jgi:predicted RNase H-like nuclease (RuvC/YqgF family)
MEDSKGYEMTEARLARIENKLDQLSEGLTALIRLDERMVTLFNRMNNVDSRIEKLMERLAHLEKIDTARGPLFIWFERIALAAMGAVVAVLAKTHFGG